jgi:hypothetical protein
MIKKSGGEMIGIRLTTEELLILREASLINMQTSWQSRQNYHSIMSNASILITRILPSLQRIVICVLAPQIVKKSSIPTLSET